MTRSYFFTCLLCLSVRVCLADMLADSAASAATSTNMAVIAQQSADIARAAEAEAKKKADAQAAQKAEADARAEKEKRAEEVKEQVVAAEKKEAIAEIIGKITEELIDEKKPTTDAAEVEKVEIGKIEEVKKKEEGKKVVVPVQVAPGKIAVQTLSKYPNPYFGQAIPSGFNLLNKSGEFNFGGSMPMTGGVSMVGRDLNYGYTLIFNKTNSFAGLGQGRVLKYSVLDDKNKADVAEQNLNKLAKHSPLFIGNFGVEGLSSVASKVKDQEYALLFPASGDFVWRTPEYKNLIYLRASLKNEVAALISYAIKKRHVRKFGIFYEDSLFGEQGLEAAEQALSRFKLKVHTKASYPKNTVSIMSAVKKIASDQPNVVLCICHSRPAYNFIQKLTNEGLTNCVFLGVGEIYPVQRIINQSRGIKLVLSSVVPNPYKSELPIVQAYRADMAKYFANRALSPFSLEGYIGASVFVEALKGAGQHSSIGTLFSTLEGLQSVDFGGLTLDFDTDDRTLSHDVWINEDPSQPWSVFKFTKEEVSNLASEE